MSAAGSMRDLVGSETCTFFTHVEVMRLEMAVIREHERRNDAVQRQAYIADLLPRKIRAWGSLTGHAVKQSYYEEEQDSRCP